jgi:hypothetical protein
LFEYLREKPTAYVDKMIEFMFDEYGVEMSDCTLFCTLEEAKWTQKVAGKHTKEHNEALQAAFYNITWYWDPVQVVAVDKSVANERTADRKRGWGPASEPIIPPYFGTRTQCSTIIPAIDVNSYIHLAWSYDYYCLGVNREGGCSSSPLK